MIVIVPVRMMLCFQHINYMQLYLPHNGTHDSKAWMFGLRQCDMAAELGRRPHPEDSMWLPKNLSRVRFTAKIIWNRWKLHIQLLDIVGCLVSFKSTSTSLVKTCLTPLQIPCHLTNQWIPSPARWIWPRRGWKLQHRLSAGLNACKGGPAGSSLQDSRLYKNCIP